MIRNIVAVLVFALNLGWALPALAQEQTGMASRSGAVYVMTNEENANKIVVYEREEDGSLKFEEMVATGGAGGGVHPPDQPAEDALGAESPLLLSEDGKWLFAVNAGSDQISVLKVQGDSLTLKDVVSSRGDFPVSLTQHGDWVYVLNAGNGGSIAGFRLNPNGKLKPLDGVVRPLNANVLSPFFLYSPAQVAFNPAGDKLVVTVKGGLDPASRKIHIFNSAEMPELRREVYADLRRTSLLDYLGAICQTTGIIPASDNYGIRGYTHSFRRQPFMKRLFATLMILSILLLASTPTAFMAGQCYTVLALDRLGAGESSRPDGDFLDLPNDADSIAQILVSLRTKQNPTHRKFKRIVLVGHSFGSLDAIYTLGEYGNVADALVVTAWLNSPGTVPIDPAFFAQLLQNAYIEVPGAARTALFYYLPSADQAMVDIDNATLATTLTRGYLLDGIDIFTARALGDIAQIKSLTKADQVSAPVFIQVGDNDVLFPSALGGDEANFYSNAPSVNMDLLTNIGHGFNLHLNHLEGWLHIDVWIDTMFGLSYVN